MKKFITTIPLQPEGKLEKEKGVYKAVDNLKLQYDKEVSFPILAVMNGYVEEGEKIDVLAIKQKHVNADRNYEVFQRQLGEFEKERNCHCEVILIEAEYDDSITEHLKTFGKLIEHVAEEDDMYACMTYGTKPIALVEMMAVNYAYRVKNQTSVGCIAYGQKDHEAGGIMKIYDMTSLFMMDEIVRKAADMKVQDPLKFIQTVLEQ